MLALDTSLFVIVFMRCWCETTNGGGTAYFLKLESAKEGLIISAEQLLQGRPKTMSEPAATLLHGGLLWGRHGGMDLIVPLSLEPPLMKSMALRHGRCVQGITKAHVLGRDGFCMMQCMMRLGAIATVKC